MLLVENNRDQNMGLKILNNLMRKLKKKEKKKFFQRILDCVKVAHEWFRTKLVNIGKVLIIMILMSIFLLGISKLPKEYIFVF